MCCALGLLKSSRCELLSSWAKIYYRKSIQLKAALEIKWVTANLILGIRNDKKLVYILWIFSCLVFFTGQIIYFINGDYIHIYSVWCSCNCHHFHNFHNALTYHQRSMPRVLTHVVESYLPRPGGWMIKIQWVCYTAQLLCIWLVQRQVCRRELNCDQSNVSTTIKCTRPVEFPFWCQGSALKNLVLNE